MTHEKEVKVEVTIRYRYDDEIPRYIDERVAEATAIDLAIRCDRDIEDGVQLIRVYNPDTEAYWLL